jgi:molybdate transport system substrate-binding protein
MKHVGAAYAAEGHLPPVFNFAASSELARQIAQGAGADVFISADEAWMDFLAGKNLIEPSTRATLLTNTLVLATPADSPLILDLAPGLNLADALKGGKLAMGNPDSVPAGRYGKQALQRLGAWAEIKAFVVRAENVRAALRFVEAGEAAAGIVYATDAKAAGPSIAIAGAFPADSHTPITYPAAILSGKAAGPGRAFLAFLGSPAAANVFESAGFGRPSPLDMSGRLPPT